MTAEGVDLGTPTSAPRGERILTTPLAVFLLAVVGILAFSAYEAWSAPTLTEAVRQLADGDVDGPERPDVLRSVVDAAATSADPMALWAGMLAAVALADRPAFERARARLGPGPAPAVLSGDVDRALVHLGDPMLGNLSEALSAEAAGDPAAARRRWLQVQAQCRLVPRPLAAELAVEALARLPR